MRECPLSEVNKALFKQIEPIISALPEKDAKLEARRAYVIRKVVTAALEELEAKHRAGVDKENQLFVTLAIAVTIQVSRYCNSGFPF